MKNYKKAIALTAICLMASITMLHAQTAYKIAVSKNNDMVMSGTSTLHDWSTASKTFTGDAQFAFKTGNNHELASIKALSFSLAVTDLQSGESGLDKNAYKALKSDQYKHIVYKLTSAKMLPQKNSKYEVETTGNLTIAGVTKVITMDVYYVINTDDTITFTGSDKLNMTDYSVKRPTFMLGAMKTGDAVTLDFTAVYGK
jgi:polyisoprenoid-binding protein YceI